MVIVVDVTSNTVKLSGLLGTAWAEEKNDKITFNKICWRENNEN